MVVAAICLCRGFLRSRSYIFHSYLQLYLAFSSSSPFSGQWAAGVASVHDRPLLYLAPADSSCRSSQNVDCQVFLGLPLLFLPSTGIQSIALWAGRSGAIRRTCPANRNLSVLRCLAAASSVRFVSFHFVSQLQLPLLYCKKTSYWYQVKVIGLRIGSARFFIFK